MNMKNSKQDKANNVSGPNGVRHTPGPWTVGKEFVYAANGDSVARIDSNLANCLEAEPNARLIAAAPDLAQALRVVLEAYRLLDEEATRRGFGDYRWAEVEGIAEAALAKAEGKE
jgi:hypothetical protein